jgi:hypothetical protein
MYAKHRVSHEASPTARRGTMPFGDETCTWQEDENNAWETSCGNIFEFFNDGPKQNKFKFCPYCGRPISSRRYKP